ncbi:MAG: flagellar biosynthesis anti-sigma factor FlgM [Chromatiales bacterium]|jgi:negative regulator of flagellin synthesis FlgM|nr:flagellar biosynthesis anti-sigma factor FlgM [Chromatiales bacterium]
MAIEISGHNLAQTGSAGDSAKLRAVRSDDNAAAQTKAGVKTDTVQLTGTAALMQKIDAQIAAEPVVDLQRVEAIRQQIENGTYQIDPQRVAEKMIHAETALYGSDRT